MFDRKTLSWLLVVSFLSCGAVAVVGHADGDEAGAEKKEEVPKPWTEEEQERILSYFLATEKEFDEEGHELTLVYDFSSMNDVLVEDWAPSLDKTKGRVRWTRGYEGTYSTVEHGIVVADYGVWIHKAQWKEVTFTMEYLSMQGSKPGDFVGPVLAGKKKALASNMGKQVLPLKGTRIAGKPIPAAFPAIQAEQKYTFGFTLKDGVFSVSRGGGSAADSSKKPKLLKGLIPGRTGLAWKGNVLGFIPKVTIKGRLDPDWVAKQ